MIDKVVGHYKIIEELGAGGMGVVYKAQDLKLERIVALKFIRPEFCKDEEFKRRFINEAKAASALENSHVGTIHEIGDTDDGGMFIVESYYDCQSLKDKLAGGPLEISEAVELAAQIAQGLDAIHKGGIVHRDIKPANILVTKEGEAKIIDFGLARQVEGTRITQEGVTPGTPNYMAPEQVRNEPANAATDVWALGVTLYEMLTGQLPFHGENVAATAHAIVHEQPAAPASLREGIPYELERIAMRALRKAPQARYASAAELLKDLREAQASISGLAPASQQFKSLARRMLRPYALIPLLLVLGAMTLLAVQSYQRSQMEKWARNEAIPELKNLIGQERFSEAFDLATEAELYIPDDTALQEMWPNISHIVAVTTDPPGARVWVKGYYEAEANWQRIGESPIEDLRLPLGPQRWKINKQGYQELQAATFEPDDRLAFSLVKDDLALHQMVKIPAIEFALESRTVQEPDPIQLDEFYIDKYEVTNRQYKEFVDAGGYKKEEYWIHQFVDREGLRSSWPEAMQRFQDSTGRPGPSAWEVGDYPKGQDNFPVTGVSWYEAAAYAEFRGKQLPTLFHWFAAALGEDKVSQEAAMERFMGLSNFEDSGPQPVGRYAGTGPFGTYDMAGNVKEWVWNGSPELAIPGLSVDRNLRFILGGAWNEAGLSFMSTYPESPFDRHFTYGFRCAKYIDEAKVPDLAFAGLRLQRIRDRSSENLVSEDVYQASIRHFIYDQTGLDPILESVDESADDWKKEKISFRAAYGEERMFAYVFLPKNTKPPYQAIVFFPGNGAIYGRSSEDAPQLRMYDYVIKSGRAVIFPIYKSTYERHDELTSVIADTTRFYTNHVIQWVNDARRSVDYLTTRDDIDEQKVGYLGYSWGGAMGPLVMALEDRIKVAVYLTGGFGPTRAAGLGPENFAAHVTAPVLMLNAKNDTIFPLKTSSIPLFELLGTPEEHKKHLTYPGGHGAIPRSKLIKETLDWFDTYLGRPGG